MNGYFETNPPPPPEVVKLTPLSAQRSDGCTYLNAKYNTGLMNSKSRKVLFTSGKIHNLSVLSCLFLIL